MYISNPLLLGRGINVHCIKLRCHRIKPAGQRLGPRGETPGRFHRDRGMPLYQSIPTGAHRVYAAR
jgi:hypothetical protein